MQETAAALNRRVLTGEKQGALYYLSLKATSERVVKERMWPVITSCQGMPETSKEALKMYSLRFLLPVT